SRRAGAKERIAGIKAPKERRMVARGETPGTVENHAVKPHRGGGGRQEPVAVGPLEVSKTLCRVNQELRPWLVSFAPLGLKWYAEGTVEGASRSDPPPPQSSCDLEPAVLSSRPRDHPGELGTPTVAPQRVALRRASGVGINRQYQVMVW